MLERISFDNRTDWLNHRSEGIGASEAAAIVGISPWMTNVELWELKTGKRKPKDISDNKYVDYGNRVEEIMRMMFSAEHPEVEVKYHQFDFLFQTETPWLRSTLDGEIHCKSLETPGVLEIKTAQMVNRNSWDKWQDKIPDYYYTQILHQLLSTKWNFVNLYAKLCMHGEHTKNDSQIRNYPFYKADLENDMEYLLEQEYKFWNHNVQRDIPPALILPAI